MPRATGKDALVGRLCSGARALRCAAQSTGWLLHARGSERSAHLAALSAHPAPCVFPSDRVIAPDVAAGQRHSSQHSNPHQAMLTALRGQALHRVLRRKRVVGLVGEAHACSWE